MSRILDFASNEECILVSLASVHMHCCWFTFLWVDRTVKSQNRPGWKGPWKIIWSNLSRKRKPGWDYRNHRNHRII